MRKFVGRIWPVSIGVIIVILMVLSSSSLCLAASWSSVSQPGFGNSNNIGVYSQIVFKGYLYAGTRSLSGGCEVRRSRTGTDWALANTKGFGDTNNWAAWCMAVFNNNLYVGTYNETTGAEIWRSSNGTTWSQVNTDGFGSTTNKGVYSLCIFGNYLYAGTYNQSAGGRLFRTANGTTWNPCSGSWSANNSGIYSSCVLKNVLYIGTSNPTGGCELWKSANGTTFSKVGQSGFGDANNQYLYCLSLFNGNLFAGTYNLVSGCQVWRSSDGATWTKASADGFGSTSNKSVWSFAVFNNNLYAGIWTDSGGTQVWRTPDGGSWVQANTNGFSNTGNQIALSMCPFENYLYAGTYNSTQGGIVYRYGPLSDLALPDLWYFAEGTTRSGFHTWLCIENPQQIDAKVDITYMMSTSEYLLQSVTVPALSRQTVDVNAFIAGEKDFSMKVSSSQPVLVERPMYFDYKGVWTGGHDAIGAPAGRTAWYFAEGTTRANFDEYLCLENPGSSNVQATVTYMLGTGKNVPQTVPIPANSRVTVNVRDAVGPNQDVSAQVLCSGPIIAERPMYFDYKGVWTGGHDAMGAAAPADSWYFAEGTTRTGFETWLCMQNPGAKAANVKASFMAQDGKVIEKNIKIAPNSRYTYSMNAALGPNVDASTLLTSDQPIVAERPMYFNYHGTITGGHDVMGANEPKTTWYLAEGTTRKGYDEWLCIQNPGKSEVEVTISYMLASGQPKTQVIKVAKQTRYTVSVNDAVGPNQDVSAKVTAPSPVIVERPMYFKTSDGITGGHVVMGFGVN